MAPETMSRRSAPYAESSTGPSSLLTPSLMSLLPAWPPGLPDPLCATTTPPGAASGSTRRGERTDHANPPWSSAARRPSGLLRVPAVDHGGRTEALARATAGAQHLDGQVGRGAGGDAGGRAGHADAGDHVAERVEHRGGDTAQVRLEFLDVDG